MTDTVSPTDRRRVRKWPAVLVLLALILGAGGFLAGRALTGRATGPFDDAGSVELPPVPDSDEGVATRSYLSAGGEGAAVLEAIVLADPAINASGSPRSCRTFAEQDLERLGTPADLYATLAAIPDQATGELALAYVDTLARFLAACMAGEEPSPDELEFSRTVLTRRLEEIR